MAKAMGAAVVGMKNVQVHPTAFIDPKTPTDQTKFLAAEALRGKGAILVGFRLYIIGIKNPSRSTKKENVLEMNLEEEITLRIRSSKTVQQIPNLEDFMWLTC